MQIVEMNIFGIVTIWLVLCVIGSLQHPHLDSSILNLYQAKFHGEGTYYGAGSTQGGICQYFPPGLPRSGTHPSMRSVALNTQQFLMSHSCGMCFKVHGTGNGQGATPIIGDSYAFVDNICPECHTGDLNFAENGDGRWDISMQAVQCPVGNSTIKYKFQGSHMSYIKLQVRNHRVPITRIELYQRIYKKWTCLKHTSDGFWEMDPNESWETPLLVPLQLRMTSANGHVMEDTIETILNHVVIPGSVQVPFDSSLPSVTEVSHGGNTTQRNTHVPVTNSTSAAQVPVTSYSAQSPTQGHETTTHVHGLLDLYKKEYTGFGTYDRHPGGQTLCQYAPPSLPPTANSPVFLSAAGLGDSLMFGSLACGTCFHAKSTGSGLGHSPLPKEFYVFVDNVCHGCPGGSLNVAQKGDGRWDLTIQAVQCPVGETKIEYKFQESNAWYIKLQIRNHRIPIVKLEMKQDSSRKWLLLKHTSDGFWEIDPAEKFPDPLSPPLRIRMTAANGITIRDVIQTIDNHVVIPGRVQVPFDSSLPSVTELSHGGNTTQRNTHVQQSTAHVHSLLDLYKKKYNGFGTYDRHPGGQTLCQYAPPSLPPTANSPVFLSAAGLGDSLMFGSLACGTCFHAKSTGSGLGHTPLPKEFYVFVDNVCHGCPGGSLNVAQKGDGRWDLTIQAVQCPVGETKIEYKFQESNAWYIKLQIRNHRIPIVKLEMKQDSSRKWLLLKHTSDGFWEIDPAEKFPDPLSPPLRIRMTAANGITIRDVIQTIDNHVVIPGRVQVPFDSSLPSVTELSHGGNTTQRNTHVQQSTAHVHSLLDLYKKKYNGFGTYDRHPGGQTLCQYAPPSLPPTANSPVFLSAAGLGDSLMFGSLACGTCFHAKSTGSGLGHSPLPKEFYVFVDNVCHGCPGGSLNVAQKGDGRWDLTIQAVQCPVGETKIEYKFQESNAWYIKLQIRNHRIPIVKLEMKQRSSRKWLPLKHTSDGFWEIDPAEKFPDPLSPPLRIRMTAANGITIRDVIHTIVNDVVIPGEVQVPLDSSLPTIQ